MKSFSVSAKRRYGATLLFCACVTLVLSLSLFLSACGGKKGQSGFGGFAVPVETATAKQGPIEDRFAIVGSLEASESIAVVSEIDGMVDALPFKEGQKVAAGALLVRLDDEELSAEVARAEAVCAQQEATYERTRNVVDQGAGAPQDLDDAAADLKVAKAELKLARARLSKTRITARFPGITGTRSVSVGAFVRAGTQITTLTRIDELRVNFTVPERILPQLHRGSTVTVTTNAYPDRSLRGVIDIIDPVLDPDTRSARIVAVIKNPDGLLRPGMSADVAVVLHARENAITIPSEAVVLQSGQNMVYVIQPDSTVAPRPVTLGLRQESTVEIVEGLKPGERVVRAGHQKLYPGAKVSPIEEQAREAE